MLGNIVEPRAKQTKNIEIKVKKYSILILRSLEKIRSDHTDLDWLALHLKIGSGIGYLSLEIIRSYVDKFNVFYYADNLKVSTIVSINFVFQK